MCSMATDRSPSASMMPASNGLAGCPGIAKARRNGSPCSGGHQFVTLYGSCYLTETIDTSLYLDGGLTINAVPTALAAAPGYGPLWWLTNGSVDLMDGVKTMGTYQIDSVGNLIPNSRAKICHHSPLSRAKAGHARWSRSCRMRMPERTRSSARAGGAFSAWSRRSSSRAGSNSPSSIAGRRVRSCRHSAPRWDCIACRLGTRTTTRRGAAAAQSDLHLAPDGPRL
jgi:hypothetical protein